MELSDLDPDRVGLPWVVSFDNGQGNVPEYNAMLRLGKNIILYNLYTYVITYKPSVNEPMTIVRMAIMKPLMANNVRSKTTRFIF